MRFTPKTEEQVSAGSLFPKGEYDFEVFAATDTRSKSSGAEMLALQVDVYNIDGHKTRIFDYLLDGERSAYKLRHFAEAIGMLEAYATGELKDYQCVGRTGTCKVNIQKDKTGDYPDKNTITDYVVRGAAAKPAPVRRDETTEESEIPF